jgi:hypothetical protein
MYDEIKNIILDKMGKLITEFSNEIEKNIKSKIKNIPKDKVICINNSFLNRKGFVSTTKNKKYLCFSNMDNGEEKNIFIGTLSKEMKTDFKVFKKEDFSEIIILNEESKVKTEKRTWEEFVKEEIENIGDLIFVLIGALKDVPCEVNLNNTKKIKKIKYDPLYQISKVDDGTSCYAINSLIYSEEIIDEILKIESADEENTSNEENIKKAVLKGFEELVEKAHFRIDFLNSFDNIPNSNSLIKKMIMSFKKQKEKYILNLENYKSGSKKEEALIELMRLSYAFADDAIKLLKVLVTIMDLKPLILWMLNYEFFSLIAKLKKIPYILERKERIPS